MRKEIDLAKERIVAMLKKLHVELTAEFEASNAKLDQSKKIVLTTTKYVRDPKNPDADGDIADELINKVKALNLSFVLPDPNLNNRRPARSEVTFTVDGTDYDAYNDFEQEDPGPAKPKITPQCIQNKQCLNYLIGVYHDAFKHLEDTLYEFEEDVYVNNKKVRRLTKETKRWLEYYRRLCLINMNLDDYRTKVAFIAAICKRLRWKPVVDLATNPIGSNSVCLLFFSAMVDALKQVEYIKGKKVMVNPVF